jgi:OmpA-OmpF porin, OOP family
VLLAVASAAVGCGDDDDDTSATTATTERATTTSTTTAVEPSDDVSSEGAPEESRTDFLTFAVGALPVTVTDTVDLSDAIDAIDGNPAQAAIGIAADLLPVEYVIELPAATTFESFGVNRMVEVPSPGTTPVATVEIETSAVGPDSGFEPALTAALTLAEDPSEEGELEEFDLDAPVEARWVKVRLVDGHEDGATFFVFSELVGFGSQESVEPSTAFDGVWDERFGFVELVQDGPTVTGCYDVNPDGTGGGTLSGTVDGRLLRATGTTASGNTTLFILAVAEDGSLQGVRSDSGAPFGFTAGPPAAGQLTPCSEVPEPPPPACGSILHGIGFAFDSADILPESEPVLAELFEGLSADTAASIVVEGHTSSEGSDAYNQDLSERRAQAVVDDLVQRGIQADRISATGKGESEPIASNDDESGRSLNRRVEIECT